jgi:hypothetical protein
MSASEENMSTREFPGHGHVPADPNRGVRRATPPAPFSLVLVAVAVALTLVALVAVAVAAGRGA